MPTLTVNSKIQKALIEHELLGQLSDGYWENTRPHDHWKPWTHCDVVVGTNIGRDFWVQKDNYDFNNPQLLSWLGGRMLAIGRGVLLELSPKMISLLCALVDIETGELHTSSWTQWQSLANKYGGSYVGDLHAVAAYGGFDALKKDYDYVCTLYDKTQLRKDLRTIKAAFRAMK